MTRRRANPVAPGTRAANGGGHRSSAGQVGVLSCRAGMTVRPVPDPVHQFPAGDQSGSAQADDLNPRWVLLPVEEKVVPAAVDGVGNRSFFEPTLLLAGDAATPADPVFSPMISRVDRRREILQDLLCDA